MDLSLHAGASALDCALQHVLTHAWGVRVALLNVVQHVQVDVFHVRERAPTHAETAVKVHAITIAGLDALMDARAVA